MPLVGYVFTADDGRRWDLATMIRTDPDNSTHPRSEWSTEEQAIADSWLKQAKLRDYFQEIRTLIGSVDLIQTQAEEDVTHADVRQGQIEDWSASTTALAATIRGITNPTIAQIREQLAVACERDVRIVQELSDFYQWCSLIDQLLELLALCVAGLARRETQTTNGG